MRKWSKLPKTKDNDTCTKDEVVVLCKKDLEKRIRQARKLRRLGIDDDFISAFLHVAIVQFKTRMAVVEKMAKAGDFGNGLSKSRRYCDSIRRWGTR